MDDDRTGWSRRGDDVHTLKAGGDEAPLAPVLDGRYRIEARVGVGGMGEIYRARDLELGEVVAVKLLADARAAATLEQLRREVRLARRVTHENVVRVHDLGVEPDGALYLTMEYVDGVSLRERIEAGPVPRDEAVRIGREICDGLDAAHRSGVIHSDLKPANVLLRRSPEPARALLSDFGIARALGEAAAGRIAGTPPYMAPEQWAGERVGVWTDVYALGLVLYELFTGERLLGAVPGPGADGTIEAQVRARLPAPLADAVAESLARDPASRPPSVRRIARALAELAGDTVRDDRPPAALRLLVLPLRQLGGPADDHLGVGLAEELTRVLAASRALEVIGGSIGDGAGDPRALGRAAGAGAVVHGSVQRLGERVRVAVELVDVDTAARLWGDRFDGTLADVFAFQEAMALRVCESMRVGWLSLAKVRPAPPEALELYMRARRQLRTGAVTGEAGCIALLEECLARAPGFEPAVALHAIATAKAWFVPSAVEERDWGEAARRAAHGALADAPALAESHIAAAIVAAQDGRYHDAVMRLDRALELAPTSADAHNYLGRLLAEAGRWDAARWHLEHAMRLDPTIQDAEPYIARHHALHGDRSRADALWTRTGVARVAALQLLLRIASWYGDRAGIERCVEALAGTSTLDRDAALLVLYGRYILGDLPPSRIEQLFDERVPMAGLSLRVQSNMHQIMVEGHALRGALELAEAHLAAAARAALIDVAWLGACPALAPLRDQPAFADAARLVRARAEAAWAA